MQNNTDKANLIFNNLTRRGHEQAEVYLSSVNYHKLNLRKKNVVDSKAAINEGYGVRIIEKGKVGFSYSNDFSLPAITETIAKAEDMIRFMDEDDSNMLPEFVENPSRETLACFDEQIKNLSIAEKIKLAGRIEDAAYDVDPRITNTEEIGLITAVAESVLVSTRIPLQSSRTTYISGYAEMIAQQGEQKEAGSYAQTIAGLDGFDPNLIGRNAARRAAVLLDAQPIPTRKMDIVLDPGVAVQFLGVMSSMFDAEQVYKGKSLLQGKIGEQIAATNVHIVDDGMLPGGLSSAFYDEEGVPTQRKDIVRDGRLLTYLFDCKNAIRQKCRSTGNAFRSSYKALPTISPSNLYLKPGRQSTTAKLATLADAFYVFEVMGLHMVNPISGEFSLGAQGILIENGEMTTGVKGVMIAGKLLDFLQQVSFVGDDLTFFSGAGYVGSPTLIVNDIMVGS